jgi:hypothetical protein
MTEIQPGDIVVVIKNRVSANHPDIDRRLEPGDTIKVDEIRENRIYYKMNYGIFMNGRNYVNIEDVKLFAHVDSPEPKAKGTHKCRCDWYTQVLRYGCICGGY